MTAMIAAVALAGAVLVTGRWRPARKLAGVVAIGAGLMAGIWWWGNPIVGLVVILLVVVGRTWWGRRTSARRVLRRREATDEFCTALAAELGAGQPAGTALRAATAGLAELAEVADAVDWDNDPARTLRRLSATEGLEELAWVGAAWALAQDTGAGLAAAVGRCSGALRERRRLDRLTAGELASATATARMMAALPIGMVLLGTSAGLDPIGFLMSGVIGPACLVAGLGLSAAGLAWLGAIARSVQQR